VCGSGACGPNEEPEVEAAHLYPKHLDDSDDVRNRICLCRRHHWAFDIDWVTITDDFTILVRPELPQDSDCEFFRDFAGRKLRLPDDSQLAPHPLLLRRRREAMGFGGQSNLRIHRPFASLDRRRGDRR
jgi:putative restriction endonuclease